MVRLFILIGTVNGGGAERIASTLQNNLPPTLSREFVIIYQGNIAYKIFGDLYTVINNYSSKNKLSKVMSNLPGFIRYINHLRTKKPRLVISIQEWENLWNLISSLIIPIVPVISVHGMPKAYTGFQKYLMKLGGYLVRIKQNARVIAVSEGVKEQYHQYYHVPYHKIKVLYNPIDVKSIQSLAQSTDYSSNLFSNNSPVIITAGRLSKGKCQHHLLRAFATLHRERSVRLLICGTGSEEIYLKKLAKDLDVEDDVIFLGWQENPYKYIAHSTVFVLSSISEALPNVLTEAMASGCPVISANCSPGVREIIGENNEYGLLAEPMTGIRHCFDDPLDSSETCLLELMQKILDDTELRKAYIKKGRERAEYFSMERRIKEYETFIQDLIEKS